jgi:hypothetical protein
MAKAKDIAKEETRDREASFRRVVRGFGPGIEIL